MPAKASFIELMLLLRTEKLPEGPEWVYELKLDGYRVNGRYPAVVKALAAIARLDRNRRRGRRHR